MHDDEKEKGIDFSGQQSLGSCPKCGGAVFEHGQEFACQRAVAASADVQTSCDFKLSQTLLQKTISREDFGKLLDTGKTDLIEGFVAIRNNKSFQARLVWDVATEKIIFDFPSQSESDTTKPSKKVKVGASAKRKSLPSAAMLKSISKDVLNQIEKCKRIKKKILSIIDSYPHLREEIGYAAPPAREILDRLHFLDISWGFVTEVCDVESVARTSSMFSGPLYCSEKYPQLYDSDANPMIPVMQIDLGWMNQVCGAQFPEALLQLWFGKNWIQHSIRLIPLPDISQSEVTPFDWSGLIRKNNSEQEDLNFVWPCDSSPRLITELNAVGLTCPSILMWLENYEHEIPDELTSAIVELEGLMPSIGSHFFGEFYHSQLEPSSFYPYKLFLTIVEWGALGMANIFYDSTEDGDPSFQFFHCNN